MFEPYECDEPYLVTCKFCGEEDLHWVDTGSAWRLFDDADNQHECPVRSTHDNFKPTDLGFLTRKKT